MMGVIFQRIGKLIRNISVPLPAEKTHKFLSFDILIDFGWRERSKWVVFKVIYMVRKRIRNPLGFFSPTQKSKTFSKVTEFHDACQS